jgi:hypothetical protein
MERCGERWQNVAHAVLRYNTYKDLRAVLSKAQLTTKAIEYMGQT